MDIKPPDLLNRLPSVAELLDKPQVRALVDRWNRSQVVGGVRSFLDEMRSDIERRASELPSIRELAERAARYVVSRQQHALGIAINATGQLGGANWVSTPLAEVALERMIALGREFAAEPQTTAGATPGELESLLCRLTGAEAVTVVHSYSGAIWLALAALATDREVLVARAEVGDVSDADSLSKLAVAARVLLKEVGAANGLATSDYEAAASPRATAILTYDSEACRVPGEAATTEFDKVIAAARDRKLILIDALGAAPLVTPPASIMWPTRTIQASIAAGADLVIVRGDGFVGGPACGILVGKRDIIGRIVDHPLFSTCQLDPLRSVALTATVECYDTAARGADTLPVWQCLATPIENLRNRGERLAAQIAHVEGVASATPVETRSRISAAIPGEGWPSYGIAVTSGDGNVNVLDNRLRSARLPIVGRVEGDRLVLDLRLVLPRQDKMIVDSLLGN